jgi:hypothetical protein
VYALFLSEISQRGQHDYLFGFGIRQLAHGEPRIARGMPAMKRAYEVRIERGDNVYGADFLVVAATDEEAVHKAKQQCRDQYSLKTGWRCTALRERGAELVS